MNIYGETFDSRLMLGTARYPSPDILRQAIAASGAKIVTVSLRREAAGERAGQAFWDIIREAGVSVLPNTAGCHSVREAVTTAEMAREVFGTTLIKLEVIGDADTLQPDLFGLVEATRILSNEGFQVLAYTTEDLVAADRLVEAGCRVLMPWGSPIGSARGLNDVYGLRAMRARFPDLTLVVDAGIGVPSHASQAMELGYDGVLLSSAVALAGDPVKMAEAFRLAVAAGRLGYEADPLLPRDMAEPSTPVLGQALLGGAVLS